MDKNIKLLKVPYWNFKHQFDGNFVESQAKERSLKQKKSSKLA